MTDETVSAQPSGAAYSCTTVALVGFMGAGKTTVGRELAQRLGWRFADLDELIEKREGRSIQQIFRDEGEAAFRRLEYEALYQVTKTAGSDPLVLALGGGAFIEPGNQRCLQEAQIPTVFLDAHVDELFRRCDQPEVNRPLRRDPEQFRQLYERRRPEYLKSAMCIETTGKTIVSVAQEIISGLNLVPVSGAHD